jgi:hypothetical protein
MGTVWVPFGLVRTLSKLRKWYTSNKYSTLWESLFAPFFFFLIAIDTIYRQLDREKVAAT